MPTYDTELSLAHTKLIAKWTKHFKSIGCSHDKTFKLARKHALREIRRINRVA
jgi:hypothetical protein